MRRTASLVLAAVVLAAWAPAEAGARDPSARCYPRDVRGLASGVRARVFHRDLEDGDYVIYACDLISGRRTRIGEGTFRDGDSVGSIRFAGRIVGFVGGSCVGLMGTPCTSSIETVDVRTRRRLSTGVEAEVTDFLVSPTGAAAWIEREGGVHRAKAISAGHTATELDSGPALEPGSLALSSGGRLYWTNAGEARSAQLDWRKPPREPRDPPVGGNRGCHPPGSLAYGASTRARLFVYLRDPDSADAVACNLRTGARTLIAPLGDDAGLEPQEIRFAGWYVAFANRFLWRARDYPTNLDVVDLRSGRIVTTDRWIDPESRATDLVLARDGVAAWGIRGEIRACRPDAECATLDPGPAEAGSLALAPSRRLFWSDAVGAPRSVLLP